MPDLQQIDDVINKIRPFINRDGGDIELISFDDGVVKVKMLGACVGCGAVDITIKQGVESILMEELNGIKHVEVID